MNKGDQVNEQLLDAASAGDAALVTRLLRDGADGNVRDAHGDTPLMIAAAIGSLEVVNALMAGRVEVNAVNPQGWGALAKAVYNPDLDRGFPDVVQALIRAGANVEAAIAFGVRPLMLAAGYGQAAVVQVLLDAGADFRARNDGGRTALMMVKEKHYVDVINMLHEVEQLDAAPRGCGSSDETGGKVVKFHGRGAGP